MSLFHPIKDPVDGMMHVVSCTAIDAREMRAPCHITYVVQSPGMAAFPGDYVFEMWTAEWPEPGEDIPVIFDREHPDRIKIDNDKRKANWVSAQDQAAQLAEQINAGGTAIGAQFADVNGDGGISATGAAPPAPPAPSADDTVSRLERLAALRSQGVLTAEEFEAQKAKILAG